MKIPLSAAVLAALAFAADPGSATVLQSAYTPLGSNHWLVDFTITNDGTPASFAGFTVSLPGAVDLALVSAPSTWDSLVIQPDSALPDDGFFDTFAISAGSYLAPGASLGGFKLRFTLASGTPGALPFVVNSATFDPLFFGNTVVSTVPEPATAWLALAGLALAAARLGLGHRRRGLQAVHTAVQQPVQELSA